MNAISDVKWETEQIKSAIEYYKEAQNKTNDYSAHKSYAETISRLTSELESLENEKE